MRASTGRTYREVVRVFTRMLDNVVEINGLPLERQRDEILRKRRHGMGFLGLGSTITMLGLRYGSKESVAFTEDVTREMAVAGWQSALELAREKGPAPIMNEEFTVTTEMLRKRPEMAKDGLRVGRQGSGPCAACPLQPVHAAACDRRSGSRRAARGYWCALHASHVDRTDRHHLAVARQQCLERHRAVVCAPLFSQRDPPGAQDQGKDRRIFLRAAGLSRAHQRARHAGSNDWR